MSSTTIYHNPHCSKSRQTLQLLEQQGVRPQVVLYLQAPPSAETLRKIIGLLGIEPIDLIRKQEPPYRELGLAAKHNDHEALIQAMVRHPVLIERPVVVHADKAAIGRPPEKVLKIL